MRGIEFAITFVWVLSNILSFAIIGRILLSWVTMGQMGPRGRISQLLYDVTEPIISLCRKLPHRIGMMDFSSLIALIGIDLLSRAIILLIENFASKI